MSHSLPRDAVVGAAILPHESGSNLCDMLFLKTTLQMFMSYFKTKCLDQAPRYAGLFFLKIGSDDATLKV
ncbi:MAG: hypothetical protein EBY64_01785 [Rhodobacteraceae bacterium]|nr:hypothetical protein [Paracoccaceae bacterium]